MVNTAKRIIVVVLTLCIMAFAIEPLVDSYQPNVAFADEKNDNKDDKKEDDKEPEYIHVTQPEFHGGKKENGDTTVEVQDGNEDDIWTNYAEIMMASAVKERNKKKKKKEQEENNKTIVDKVTGFVTAPFNKKINAILSKGGVTFEEPFSKMASDSSIIDAGKNGGEKGYDPSGKAGQITASYLATYSKYGYIDSISGNKIANGVSGWFTKIVRTFAGGIAMIGIMLYYLINKMQDAIADTMIAINPYQLFKFSDGDAKMPGNFVTDALNKGIDYIGFSREVTYAAMGLGIVIISMFFVLKFLVGLRKGSVKGASGAIKEGLTRLFTIVLMITFLSMSAHMFGVLLKGIKDKTTIGDSAVISHLYDTKSIASGTNLSPSGGVTTEKPDAGMEKNYIDKSYDPATSRKRITEANKNANWILYGTPKTTEGSKDLSFDLLNRYMESGRFNVNNYIADLRRGKDQTGTGDYLPGVKTYPEDFAKKGEKASRKTLEYSMWSATQNVDKNLRNPEFKNFKPSGTTGVSPGESTGVVNNSTFSTQSVVLMLQSSFDGENAKFNAYNLGASGEQSGMKSISTIKTEWNAVALPGDGMIGKFASWLGMIAQSISYTLIGLAVLMAMFTTNLLVGYVLFIKQAFRTLFTGSFHSAMATFLLYIATTFSTVIATFLPDMFNTFLQTMSTGLATMLKGFIPSSLVEIVASFLTMYLAWMLGWKWKIKPMDETPVRIMSTILTRAAIAYESRVSELDKAGGATDFKSASKGIFQEANTRFAEFKDGAKRDVTGNIAKYSNKTKESAVGAYLGASQGAVRGAKSGNPARVVTGTAKGFGVGMKEGYTNADENAKSTQEVSNNVSHGIANSQMMAKEYEGSEARKQRKLDKAYDKRAEIREKALERKDGAKASDANKLANNKLSNQLSVPVEDSAKDNYRHSEKKFRTFKAGQAAAYAQDEDGNPYFKQNELRQLNEADDMEGYVHSLKETGKGNAYALTTESAKAALLDSQFVDENGYVDVDKVNMFEEALNVKQEKGQLTDEDMQQKALLDSAFISGAQERYTEANNAKTQTAYKTPQQRPNASSTDSTDINTTPYKTPRNSMPNTSTTASNNAPRNNSQSSKYNVPKSNNNSSAKSSNNYASTSRSSSSKPKTSTTRTSQNSTSKPSTTSNAQKSTKPTNNTVSSASASSKPKAKQATEGARKKVTKTANRTKKVDGINNVSNKAVTPRKVKKAQKSHPNSKPQVKRNNKND